MSGEESKIEEELAFPILLSEQIRREAEKAKSFRLECAEVSKQVSRLSQLLRFAVRLAKSTPSLYQRPILCIVAQVSKNLKRALTLICKCKRGIIIRRFVTITAAADFFKLFSLLDSSIGDMKWLLSIFDYSDDSTGIVHSLPPIANIDPIMAWVWSFVAAVQMGSLPDRVGAANELAALALDNDRNKKIIIEEGAVLPLVKLLKDGPSPDAQIAAATALSNLATDQEKVRQIVAENSVPIIVEVLFNSPMRVQIQVANLISRMAENDLTVKEQFGKENAIGPLVSLLSFLTFLDDSKPHHSTSLALEGSGRDVYRRKVRESEEPEVNVKLKTNCSEALWVLSRVSVLNCLKITEANGLLCLAKLIEKERGDLQFNCLMTVMEITVAAESNVDLRRAAFKINSLDAKAVVDQLLRVIQEESSPRLQIPAIKSIGSLARTFPARATRIINPLVDQLSHDNTDVAIEAVVALAKFASPDNFVCAEHSKAITESHGVLPLMRLMRASKQAQLQGLILLCYLALNVGNNDALEDARVQTALEVAAHSAVAQHPSLKGLINKAIYRLEVYHEGTDPKREFYTM